jgi:spermidine synthase
VKNILNPGGVISLSLLQQADYYGGEARSLSSVIFNTIRTSFANIAVVPGSARNYFLASDTPLGIDIAHRIEQRGINTIFVNQYYIDDDAVRERSGEIVAAIDNHAPINRDFTPVAYYRQLAYWLSYFNLNYWAIIGICGAAVVCVIVRLNAVGFGMFVAGFSGSAIELLLVIAFQILYGYVYQMIGVIVTVFMAGLAVGSFARPRLFPVPSMKSFSAIQFCVALYVLLLPFCLLAMQRHVSESVLLQGAFVLLTFVIALLVGLEFSLASRLQPGSAAAVTSTIYGVDLFGSALGALIVGTFLIPKIGVFNVSYGLAFLSGIGGMISLMNRKKFVS